jgi:hypothetical protein
MQQQSIKTSIGILVLFTLLVTGALFLGKKQHEDRDFSETVSFENIDVKKVSSSKTYPGFEITLSYPKTGIVAIDTIVSNSINESAQAFMDDVGFERLPEEKAYTFNADFDTYVGLRTITFVYTFSDYTYGAHGNHVVKTFTFDSQNRLITLEDVFVDVDTALVTLAPHVIDILKLTLEEMFDSDWAKDGTTPTQINYSSFYLTKDSVGFIFDPYQVAPFAAGISEIEIPFSDYKELFKNTYTQ